MFFDITSATKNDLTQKNGVFFRRRHFFFLVSQNKLLSLLESNRMPQGDLEVASLWEPGRFGCGVSVVVAPIGRLICSGPSPTHQPFLFVAHSRLVVNTSSYRSFL